MGSGWFGIPGIGNSYMLTGMFSLAIKLKLWGGLVIKSRVKIIGLKKFYKNF